MLEELCILIVFWSNRQYFKLYEQGCLKPFLSIGGTLLVAMDGTDSFSSEKISCPCCTQQTQKSGKTLYRHTLVTSVIVALG